MVKRGSVNYVPRVVVEYVEEVKKDRDCSKSEAFRHTIKYAEVGREVERMYRLNWTNKLKNKKILEYLGRGKFGF